MRLAELIQTKREALGWKRAELARQAGVSESVVGRIEEGLREGRASTVLRITRALGIDPALVMGELIEPGAERDFYSVDLSDVPADYRSDVQRAIEGLVAPFRRSVNPQPRGDPASDRSRLEQLAVPGKASSYMAVA